MPHRHWTEVHHCPDCNGVVDVAMAANTPQGNPGEESTQEATGHDAAGHTFR